MNRFGNARIATVSLMCLLLAAPAAFAEVKIEERTRLEFPGVLGGLVKAFGGKAAREGVLTKTSVKGNRMMKVTDETAELIDLTEEKVYQIDMKKKSYTVLTFEQMRKQMQEALDKAKAEARSSAGKAEEPKAAPQQQEKQPEMAIDFKVQESGQKKKVNGYDAREVVATVTLREKDKPAEDGSMVVTSSMWLAPRIEAMKEVEDFERRYAEKLALPFAQEIAAQMAPAMGMYPGLGDAMGKLEVEKVNMDGTAVLTTIKAEAVAKPSSQPNEPAARPQQQKQPSIPTSLGGLLGGLGKKAAGNDNAAAKNDTGSATFMTTNQELLSVSTTVAEADVTIPANFKLQK